MGSWITTRQLLLRQDAKSSPTRDQESGELGLLTDRCQNVYISKTASERIVDTLEFFPHNYQVPQLSSTDRLLMAAKDMTNAFQNPHPDVPFASVGDDTIAALTDLAAIFKLKLQQAPSPTTQASPAKVVQLPILIPSSTQILNSPMPNRRQTRSQTTMHTQDIPNVPLPPRLVTPRTLRHSPPRVPTSSQRLLPRNLSQDDFCGMDSAHMAISLGNKHWSQRHHSNAVIHPVTGKEMEYSALIKDPRLQPLWTRGFGNECGRLFQGIRDIPGTDTCYFIELKNIPNDRKITYGKIVCDYKPHKKEKERIRLTIGGDRLDYSGDVATSAADITTFKTLINSTLSTEDAAMMTMDIKNYYLGTPLPRFEYMKMLLSRFPDEIIQKYNLKALTVYGWVYIEIRKGMYGLKQAGLLANQLLQTRLEPFGYYPARHTPGLGLNKTRPISFTLVVDDFAVKYVGKQHAEHLRSALLRTYELTTDWTATVYSGMTLKWDYNKRTYDISMPGYVSNVLSKFQHDSPKHPQHTPSQYVKPVYGAKIQYATKDETPLLTAQQCLTIQKVTGSILYYARAVYPTVLMPLNNIATEQTKATEKTQAATNQMLDYLATHPDASIRYHASDMILHIHSDASYLSVSNARSRLGGLFFLGNKSPEQDTLNGSILNVAAVIKNVVASSAESEVGACFHNAQSGAPLRVTLTELGHTQHPTPLRTDNSTAYGIVNETIKQKRSKAMDMRYHCLTDRVRQKQFDVYWRPGRENLGDYHTKHHSAQHHKDMRHLIIHEANSLQVLRGCARLLPLPQPPVRARTDARTNPSAQRATQLRSVLARMYAVSIQNQTTTTVP
jgi:hypothetical protein